MTKNASVTGASTSRVLEDALDDLREGEGRWAATSLAERAVLLHEVAQLAVQTADDWVAAACRAKLLTPSSSLAGEEWLSGPYPVAMNAATLAHTVEALDAGKNPLDGLSFGSAPGGRRTVDVFPGSVWDRLLMSGFDVRVWFRPGVTQEAVVRLAGLGQRHPERTGGVAVVLGAGNITSIAVLDTLYEVVAHNRVVILKLNPILDELLGPIRTVLAPLIRIGAVRVVTGGADVGALLVAHPAVSHVHITGSAASHDAIVYGGGEEGARRKAAKDPQLSKTITSELGGVSPAIVIPDRWSRRDIQFQAEHIATQRLHNSGHNCIATQVVVIPSEWSEKDVFLEDLRREIRTAPARDSYYPGTAQRLEDATSTHAGSVRACGSGRLIVERLAPDADADAFRVEYFSPVLAVVEVPGSGAGYLAAAADFVNDRLAGTLGANVLIHPRTRRKLGGTFDTFLASLRYGTIAVNAWTAVGYLTAAAPWGGFPGATIDDVQSGVGVVHNALLLAETERAIVTGPFRPFPRSVATGQMTITPKPAWFVRNRTAATTGRLLVRFVAGPSAGRLPRIFASALRG